MIPEELWLKTALPKRGKGTLLIRLGMGDTARYMFVPAAGCPSCKLASTLRYITGWMFLHEQPAKSFDVSLAKPSTPILKNGIEAGTGDVGVVIQRCPHCSFIPGLTELRFKHITGAEFRCPYCNCTFHLEVKTTVENLIEEVRAGQRTCFMCHSVKPKDGYWRQTNDCPVRYFCGVNCHSNYAQGLDLT